MSLSSSTISVGLSSEKMSSRVLKPPGGGHSNIFGPPEEESRPQRPKNNQQNSSMMCEIMGKPVAPPAEKNFSNEPSPSQENAPRNVQMADPKPAQESTRPAPAEKTDSCPARTKVPPGGFSSGFW
ncbi:uncharacterized protein LOC143917142 [Arctopsyche grandis]|uniref:uncharacterized protein LOC143917142 n=1 Tax=Arctopsyche grandis TaxID=121162 RepID=UPI00406D871C